MTLKRAGFLVVGAIVIIIAVTYAAASSSSTVTKTKLGHHTFAIPTRYSLEGTVPAWLRWLPGLDDSSREALLEFSAEEIAEHVRSYQSYDGRLKENIIARLVVLTPVEVERYRDAGRYRDLWTGEGSYRERIIKRYRDRPWFKVFRKVEYPYSWAVLTRSPENDKALPREVFDFWVAQCLTQNSPLTASGKHTSCQTYIFFDDILIDFKIAEQNLDVINDVKAYLKTKVLEWKRSA